MWEYEKRVRQRWGEDKPFPIGSPADRTRDGIAPRRCSNLDFPCWTLQITNSRRVSFFLFYPGLYE